VRQNVESGLKLQADSMTSAIDYIKTYMTAYVAGNELSADFYAYVFIQVKTFMKKTTKHQVLFSVFFVKKHKNN